MEKTNRVLVKLAPGAAFGAASAQANLRPLHDELPQATGFGAAEAVSGWHIADLPDTVGPNPWDLAHAQVAAQLGIDESAVLFAEPDLLQRFNDPSDTGETDLGLGIEAGSDACAEVGQDGQHDKAVSDRGFAWHLLDDFSQLGSARAAVKFSDPRTRIAHIDTGYDPKHIARPKHIVKERNFADDGFDRNSAAAPPLFHMLPNNLNHGTGTVGILAGGKVPETNDYLGGAYDADIAVIRIANSVIMFRTSAFAQALRWAVDNGCDVVSLSMGGLPSRAWNEEVNNAYLKGLCICAAAGNNFSRLPSRHVVYPARYHRTIAVCGVMANGRPYQTSAPAMQGSWGPNSSMTAAIAAYTPNIPWPVFQCSPRIRLNGEGTSAATPQVAAAVALWYERHKAKLPRNWRRVEAVRHALFSSTKPNAVDPEHFGNGILQAMDALSVGPDLKRAQTPPDNDSFAFLRIITGFGIGDPPPREEMFNLELTQLYLTNEKLNQLISDPGEKVKDSDLRRFMEAVVEDENASIALRRHIANRYSLVAGVSIPKAPQNIVPPAPAACNPTFSIPDPPFRRLRAYAVDPSLSQRLSTVGFSEVTLKVRWEKLSKGPEGEYLSVVDTDATGFTYEAVDLDSQSLVAQDGVPPAEGNPAFHQQMVYAVAMNTIQHFERALGRPVLWRPRSGEKGIKDFDDSVFVRRLTVRPHALFQANAFYSPDQIALLFGYFNAQADDPGDHVPGSKVYACLSHDIVAHETTHAILDGMHRRFNEATNPDVLALHEAFADIVALMQHFTIPEILENEIARSRGNLESETILGSLAVEFGRARGARGALRDAIGKLDANGNWTRLKPNPADYQTVLLPHSRGAILVAAVFDAFLAIYATRTADLLRLYTSGTGVLPAGAIHPDLVRRLGNEAVKSATHVLNMCIRALDYIPPVDITFGEYLRGIITADSDLVPDDPYNYRVAFVEAFRRRGIYPLNLPTLSVTTLRWQGIDLFAPIKTHPVIGEKLQQAVNQLKSYADACTYIEDREELFDVTRNEREVLHDTLEGILHELPRDAAKEFAEMLGLKAGRGFEVHELRRAMRVGPDGQVVPQIIVALTQSTKIKVDSTQQVFRGGSTLVIDLSKPAVKYAIRKRINSESRQERTVEFVKNALKDPLQKLALLSDRKEPFAALHELGDV